jgi:hypothetical protein
MARDLIELAAAKAGPKHAVQNRAAVSNRAGGRFRVLARRATLAECQRSKKRSGTFIGRVYSPARLADSPNAILTLWAQKSGIAGLRVGALSTNRTTTDRRKGTSARSEGERLWRVGFRATRLNALFDIPNGIMRLIHSRASSSVFKPPSCTGVPLGWRGEDIPAFPNLHFDRVECNLGLEEGHGRSVGRAHQRR